MAPRYQNLAADSIAEVSAKGAHARVIAGELGDAKGPASTLMPTFLWHVRIDPGATFEAPIADGHEAAVYVIDGRAVVGEGTQASTGELAVLDGTTGGLRVQNAAAAPLEVMVLGGAPAEGPLVFHGPFVMNSVDQVRAAEIAYRTGRMGLPGLRVTALRVRSDGRPAAYHRDNLIQFHFGTALRQAVQPHTHAVGRTGGLKCP
jgi:redox-sensitive bicupin YhaK (pirin superfamily)